MTEERPRGSSAETQAQGERLESWKEIAAYLRRDVRTVQRWEQTDGLPIHRHKRAHRPIPYAYKAELDAWWTGRSDMEATAASQLSPAPAPASRNVLRVAAALLAIAIIGVGASWTARVQPSSGTIDATEVSEGTGDAGRVEAVPPTHTLPPKSVGVLPFVDLTEGMPHEEFADGMTEEIINRLHATAGFRVPAPTSTFYFKNKDVPVGDIARALHVSYLVDGSVRKSGATVRVSVRLIQADRADVVWSETYDRPWRDMLLVQDDIAGEVAKALIARVGGGTPGEHPGAADGLK
jgi:TolB-like protein